MTLTFYSITDDFRKLDKTVGTSTGSSTGELHERVNDLQFTVRLPGTMATIAGGANYCYVDLFGKYYFVRSLEVENNTVYVTLYEDVRMNFATQIKAMPATITRTANERKADAYLLDNKYIAKAYRQITTKDFPNELTDFSFILMTVG